jgi:hypothetical protein
MDIIISFVMVIAWLSWMTDGLERAEDSMSIGFVFAAPMVPICYAYKVPNTALICIYVFIITIGVCKKLRRGRPLIEFE